MESNSTPSKDKAPAKPPADPALATTGPQAALAPGDSFNAGGHPTLNTKPLFKLMVEKKASDLFFTSNAPIKIKIEGQILPVNKQVLTPETVRQTAFALMSPEQREHFVHEFELDFAISEPGLGRFRVNVFMQRGFPAMVLRYITADMPRMESLGLPPIMTDLVLMKRGLILMVGATGSGKSTSLAAMINYRNENASDHIVTIEDPIEFLHTNKRSIVNQREVGIDTKSYSRALRGVVRAAPDVILIGEIRDRESMEAAINLAGTGHLVLATLHANNCAESLDRIINMFPREQHNQIFLDMSQYLRAILAQRLIMGRDGKRVAAVEVMINTPHIQELVKKGDVMGIKEAITSSGERGIQSFDVSLRDLFKSGRIELEEALSSADSRANLEAKINFG
ncbi:MAG: twitching motility protein PilU [Gammaproteobacteria bacterium]|jgi:twitching motility protein PilU|nr:twitching motility protein PilU [Gammaproteobacteria bacterium]